MFYLLHNGESKQGRKQAACIVYGKCSRQNSVKLEKHTGAGLNSSCQAAQLIYRPQLAHHRYICVCWLLCTEIKTCFVFVEITQKKMLWCHFWWQRLLLHCKVSYFSHILSHVSDNHIWGIIAKKHFKKWLHHENPLLPWFIHSLHICKEVPKGYVLDEKEVLASAGIVQNNELSFFFNPYDMWIQVKNTQQYCCTNQPSTCHNPTLPSRNVKRAMTCPCYALYAVSLVWPCLLVS